MPRTTPIIYVDNIEFTGSVIKDATIQEEFSPLGLSLPLNIFEFKLHTTDPAFSILDPTGIYEKFYYVQPVAVYINIDGNQIFMGKYFLDTWENTNDQLLEFRCMDYLGLLGLTRYRGDIWLTPIALGDLLNSLLTPLNIAYELDPSLYNFPITGWIPICTYREALQQILFAAGAYIQTTRFPNYIKIGRVDASGVISSGLKSGVGATGQSRIWQPKFRQGTWELVEPLYYITKADKGITQNVTLRQLVTGVELTLHTIREGVGERTLYDGEITPGEHEITFSQPMWDVKFTSLIPLINITEIGANYCIIENLAVNPEYVTLVGNVYDHTTNVIYKYIPNHTNYKENIISIQDAPLVNDTNGEEILDRVYNYYQQRLTQSAKVFHPKFSTANTVIIDTLYNKKIKGVVEKMDIDLARGFTAEIELVGSVQEE